MSTPSAEANSKIDAGNLFKVDGLIAVVTGGGSGLGQMMARTLALNGAKKVFIIGRREDSLNQTVASVSGSVPADTIIPLVGDVTSKESLAKCADIVRSQVSYIDVLIANSGISGPSVPTNDPQTQEPLPISQLAANMWSPTPEAVNTTYAVNITGVHFTIAAFLTLLAAANEKRPAPSATNFTPRPQIITTGSIGGFNRRPFGNFSYGASKAAVMHLTKQLATTLVPYDIRANAIAPGLYLSEMTGAMYDRLGRTQAHNVEGTWPKDTIPATRSGDEQDMAGVVLWLCSRAGAYINGNIAVTDGGRLAVLPASY